MGWTPGMGWPGTTSISTRSLFSPKDMLRLLDARRNPGLALLLLLLLLLLLPLLLLPQLLLPQLFLPLLLSLLLLLLFLLLRLLLPLRPS